VDVSAPAGARVGPRIRLLVRSGKKTARPYLLRPEEPFRSLVSTYYAETGLGEGSVRFVLNWEEMDVRDHVVVPSVQQAEDPTQRRQRRPREIRRQRS